MIDGWVPVYGGGQNHVWEICKHLIKEHNCNIDLYVRSLKDDKGKVYSNNENHFNGKLKIIRVGPAFKFFNPLGRLLHILLTPFYIKGNYDIIHAHAYMSAFPAKITKFFKRIPLIFTVHGTGLEVMEELSSCRLSAKIKRFLEKLILLKMKYDLEITVSRDFLKYKNKNKVIYIPNGVNIEKFDKVNVKKEKKNFKIIFVGRLCKQKGVIYLLKAMKKIIKENKNIILHLVGDGEDKKELEEYTRKMGLENYVKFCGPLFGNELIKEYKSSHLFVLPSLYEGQSLTLLEAWASKLPVIVTSVGDNPYIVKDGLNGYLVKPRDSGSLSKKILFLLSSKELNILGENGYDYVKRNHSWGKIASDLFLQYQKFIKKV
ncbi:MAG: glycosyltransferase family 4 protein [Candidatus Woesearchaeota archaeon]